MTRTHRSQERTSRVSKQQFSSYIPINYTRKCFHVAKRNGRMSSKEYNSRNTIVLPVWFRRSVVIDREIQGECLSSNDSDRNAPSKSPLARADTGATLKPAATRLSRALSLPLSRARESLPGREHQVPCSRSRVFAPYSTSVRDQRNGKREI